MNKHYFRSLQNYFCRLRKPFLHVAKANLACCKSQSCKSPPQNTFLATFLLRVGKISQ